MINTISNIESSSDPFPHIIIEEAFNDYIQIDEEFPTPEMFSSAVRMDYDMTYPNDNYLNLITTNQIYNDLHNYVYSKKFIEFMLDKFRNFINDRVNSGELLYDPFNLKIVSSPYELNFLSQSDNTDKQPFLFPRLDLGMGGKKYGKANGGAGIHTDNIGRLISILYYVNTPESMTGGSHRMWGIKEKNPVLSKSVKPKKGRLLASLQTNYALHDVDPVTEINGFRKAFYLAVSCNKPIWKKSDDWLMKLTSNRDSSKETKSLKDKIIYKVKKYV